MIEIKNLDVIFGDKPDAALALLDQGSNREQILEKTGQVLGVKGASLKVERGEICVLMGLSGSGKSSLLRCVNGLNPISRGEVNIEYQGKMINFAEADATTQRELRMKTISMVFQKFALMPWLSVAENVSMPLELQGMDKKEIKSRVQQQLDIVGLTEWAEHKPGQLSGGMQQRVGLARALASESDILLMDEPFSALDPLIRSQLQDELLQLQKQLNKTIIFVSHDLDEALKIGNHIAIMKDGEIVQHGNPQDIVMNPANDYVREFVAHTNPMNVLLAKDLMRSLAELEQTDKGFRLSKRHDYWLSADKNAIIYRDQETPLQKQTIQKTPEGQNNFIYAATGTIVSADTSMREVLEIRYETDHAVFIEENNKIVGFIGDRELFHSLLGKMLDND
ncbi:choline ABC transporter ATP-binding protein [Bacterioplanoides sp.]|uniref:choline ABC transporter ATP-binding protein n=1 Tax=Bacterioplanoides sp. TaxID=2066072 RepID=UPI003B00E61A